MVSMRFSHKVSVASRAGQLIRRLRVNRVAATERGRGRHRLLKTAILVSIALTEAGRTCSLKFF